MSLLRSLKLIRGLKPSQKLLLSTRVENRLLSCPGPFAVTQAISIIHTDWIRHYATAERSVTVLEPILQKLDSDVRRMGRVNSRDMQDLLEALRHKLEVNSVQALMILGCCGELLPEESPKHRTELAQKIWSMLQKQSVPMDISHYNALLLCYIQNEHPFSPEQFLSEVESKGLAPNRVTYQRLMWRYCQKGDLEGATKLLEKMRDSGLPVSEPVLNALVMGHAYHGDPEGAKAVIETMSAAGLHPSGRTYALLACGYAKKGDVEGINAVIDECSKKEIVMSDKDLLDIVEQLVLSNKSECIDQVLDKMPKGAGFNQNALNLIIRLINAGHVETAKKIFETVPKPSNLEGKSSPYRGSFLVKQMVKADLPAEKIIEMCRQLEKEDLAPLAIKTATEQALYKADVHLAKLLFNELKKSGQEIRPHYYWPLLAKRGKEGDEESLISLLRHMLSEDVAVTSETLKNYAIPYLMKKYNADNTILKIQGAGLTSFFAARNVVIYFLEEGNLKLAAKVAVNYRPWGKLSLLSQPLISALNKTKDIESFATVLQVACGGNMEPETSAQDEDESEPKNDQKQSVGYTVFGAVRVLRDVELVGQLFTLLLEKGIGMNGSHAEKIQEYLGEKMTSELTEKLAKLTSNDLEVTQVVSTRRRVQAGAKSPAQIEQALAKARESGSNTADLSKQLIGAYIRANDDAKLNEFLSELERENFILTGPILAQLIEHYSKTDNVEKALEYLKLLQEREPDFQLNEFKLLWLAYAFIKQDKFDEAVKVLKEKNHEPEPEKQAFAYNSLVWQILNHLAEKGDEQKLKELLNTMLECNYVQPSNVIFGPLIKVHLIKEDIESAIKEFEECCKKYRCTPWKSEITKRLIISKDANRLQHITDLSTEIHGEVNSLYDLVLGFVECGRVVQARRILETPGLRARSDRIETACERYLQEGKTEYLESLLEATKKLSHVDRANIFYYLLVSYTKESATEKALGLWTLLQEEGESPSEQFLIHLAEHLKSKNMEIPFVVPETEKPVSTKNELKQEEVTSDRFTTLKAAIQARALESIIKIFKAVARNDNITKSAITECIELFANKGRLEDATNILLKSLEIGNPPERRATKYLLKLLAEANDMKNLNRIGSKLNEKQKKDYAFDSKLTRAKISAGNVVEHLDYLEKVANTGTEEMLAKTVREYPVSEALVQALQANAEKCESIAHKFAEKNLLLPVNLLWMEYLIEENMGKAEELWTKYLKDCSRLAFGRLLKIAMERKKPHLIEHVLEKLTESASATHNSKLFVYSKLIDCYVSLENVEKVNEVMNKLKSDSIALNDLGKTSMLRATKFLEKHNIKN